MNWFRKKWIKLDHIRELACPVCEKQLYGCIEIINNSEYFKYCNNCPAEPREYGCKLYNAVADMRVKVCPLCKKYRRKK